MFSSQEAARRVGGQKLYDTARHFMWERLGMKSDVAKGCLNIGSP